MIRVFENIDCMEGMEKYRDLLTGRRTLAIVDPPYGIGVGGSKPFGGVGGSNIVATKKYKLFDDSKPPKKDYFDRLREITNNQIIWGGNYFIDHLNSTSCMIVWDKDNSGNFADAELAWCSFETAVRIFKWRWNGLLQQNMKEKERRIHINHKPVALYRWLLQNYAKPGDLILDTHVGSASSLIACEIEGFEYIGFELDAEYYAAATERIKNHRKQPGLFDKKPEPVEREQLNLLEAQ